MSLPYEQIQAQERVWTGFCNGNLPRKMWPKHLMTGTELKLLFDRMEEYKVRSQVFEVLLDKLSNGELLDHHVSKQNREKAIEREMNSPEKKSEFRILYGDFGIFGGQEKEINSK